MIIFDWPRDLNWRPMQGRFGLLPITHLSQSPYTGSLKNILLTQIWHAEFTFNHHSIADGVDIQGFIEGLEGGANPVRMFDPWRSQPLLVSTAQTGFSDGSLFSDGTGFTDGYTLLVDAAASKGATYITLNGFPASQAVFKRGDIFGLNGCLYQVRTGVSSNAAGKAVVWVQPGLRGGCAAGDTVNCFFPTCQMRLLNGLDMLSREFNISSTFTLQFVEDVT